MRRDHRKWLWWLAVGGWIAVILGFSGQGFSAQSTSRFLVPLLRWIHPAMSTETEQLLQFLVRKAAHAFEYAVLAALGYRALRESSSPWRSAGLAVAMVVAVAAADEIHQTAIAVRSGSARDVVLDAASGGATLLLLLGRRRTHRQKPMEREAPG